MSYQRNTRHRTPTKGSHQIAKGDIGDVLYWQPGYELLEHAEALLDYLQNFDRQIIPWDSLFKGIRRFDIVLARLKHGDQLHFDVWGDVHGFDVRILDEEDHGSMSGWWTLMGLWMDHDQKQQIFRDFQKLVNRLELYPPMARFL